MSVGTAAVVKEKLDIVESSARPSSSGRPGTTWKGLCPFHGEKTPSFTVTPARETWKCFGCGRGGDIFNFVMERDGVDFATALRSLAGRAGVELSERTTREDAERKRLRDALEAAVAFYHQVLTGHPAGAPARRLPARLAASRTRRSPRYQLGFAPDAWDALTTALGRRARHRRGRPRACRASSSRRPQRRGVYDRFRGRIIFPIRDASAAGPTGLAGRILGQPDRADSGPKYLNSPQTLLFDKSRTLYLIDRAKAAIRKTGRVVLVEGNTDALMAHQAGFDERRVQHGHGADGRPGGAAHPLRAAHRARVRRRLPPARTRPRSARRS